jgi:hypothetical protein
MAHIGCDGRNAPEPKGIAPMPYYVFAGTTGTRVAVTDDKSGKKIPPHPLETWVLQRELNLNRRDDGTRIAMTEAEMAEAIKRDGYFFWPPPKKGEGH